MYGARTYSVPVGPLAQFLGADQHVDVVFIDVEGAEMSVLRGIEVQRLRPRTLIVENVAVIGGAEEIRSHLRQHGYRLVARIGASDDVFAQD